MSGILLTVLLISLWLAVLGWHAQENKRLAKDLAGLRLPGRFSARMLRLSWGRSFQVLLVLGFCFGLFLLHEWKMSHTRQGYEAQIAALGQQLEDAQEEARKTREQQVAAMQAASNAGGEVGAVFNAGGAAASPLDALKRRYEELFVNFLFLSRCGATGYNNFQIISEALAREGVALSAPAGFSTEVTAAARGTYQEVYLNTSCAAPEVKNLSERFAAYVDNLRLQNEAALRAPATATVPLTTAAPVSAAAAVRPPLVSQAPAPAATAPAADEAPAAPVALTR